MQTKPQVEAEKRSIALPVERRADDAGKTPVAGYAAVFSQEMRVGDWFREVVAPGAFTETLKSADVRAYFDHDTGRVLGRKSAGTLRLSEDSKGLAVEIDMPDTNDGRDVLTLIERGDISGMSFGFRVTRQEWDETDAVPLRTILECELFEVSIVSEPAYDGTSIALRSLAEARQTARAHNFSAMKLRHRMKRDLDLKARSKA